MENIVTNAALQKNESRSKAKNRCNESRQLFGPQVNAPIMNVEVKYIIPTLHQVIIELRWPIPEKRGKATGNGT